MSTISFTFPELVLQKKEHEFYFSDESGCPPESNLRRSDECSGVCLQGCEPPQTPHALLRLHALQAAQTTPLHSGIYWWSSTGSQDVGYLMESWVVSIN